MVHPFDDADIIAGQGTIALEMLKQHRRSTLCAWRLAAAD